MLLRTIFLGICICGSSATWAQYDPTLEAKRLTQLSRAQTAIDVMDNMTPDEIAGAMGVPQGEQFTEWLENQIDLLFTPTALVVDIRVSVSQQRIWVIHPGGVHYDRVSSGMDDHKPGARGYRSKQGCYTPYSVQKMHLSKQYNMTPMPNSIFYFGGYAIHATNASGLLGKPASHGCVRVSHSTSQMIYDLVLKHGRENTRVCVLK